MTADPDSARYHRQRILSGFGRDAQQRLADARVVVIGAGGLGSTVLPSLAAAGVGTLAIVDADTVDTSNLHRQLLFGAADVARSKADAAADAVAALAPDVTIERHGIRFDSAAAAGLLRDADLLIDGSDNIATRYAADEAARTFGIPLVWGSALRYSAQVGVAWDAKGTDFRDLFPEQPDELGDTCELVGVLPTVCAVAGAMMATEAIKLLTGIGEPLLGRVAVYDALTGSTRELAYRRDPVARAAMTSEASPAVSSVTAEQLAQLLSGPTPPYLLDVREPAEAAVAALPGSLLIPLAELSGRLDEVPRDVSIVVYCHHGIRSARGAELLLGAGFDDVQHLSGGLDAWSLAVEPAMPRY